MKSESLRRNSARHRLVTLGVIRAILDAKDVVGYGNAINLVLVPVRTDGRSKAPQTAATAALGQPIRPTGRAGPHLYLPCTRHRQSARRPVAIFATLAAAARGAA
jgi:hypothetical protein